MPQMNKGGKFIFGQSLIREDLSIRLPEPAILEYEMSREGRVFISSGSKQTGGFIVMRKGLLLPSKLGHLLIENPKLCEYELPEGELMAYKGRRYGWLAISKEGVLQLTPKLLGQLELSVGMSLLAIRSSNIAFTMGAKGSLLEKAKVYPGEIEVY